MAVGDKLRAFRDKKVLVTGVSGFKGAWLTLMLEQLGAQVLPYRSPRLNKFELADYLNLNPEFFELDITDPQAVETVLRQTTPDYVVNLASKVLVSESFAKPIEYFRVNLNGTKVLFENVLRSNSIKAALHVSTDKVYAPGPDPHTEYSRIGGVFDPYSASKVAGEWALKELLENSPSHSARVAIARGGNVIGGGDGNTARLMSDVWKSLKSSETLRVRNPEHTRPWQYVLDCLSAYLLILLETEKGLAENGEVFNVSSSSHSISVEELIELTGLMNFEMGKEPDGTIHESSELSLDSRKLEVVTGWRHLKSVEEAVHETVAWIRADSAGKDMIVFSRGQVSEYLSL